MYQIVEGHNCITVSLKSGEPRRLFLHVFLKMGNRPPGSATPGDDTLSFVSLSSQHDTK